MNIKEFIKANEAGFLVDLKSLIAIDSVASEATADAPYGEGNKKAIDFMMKRAQEMGLSVGNCDNRVCYAYIEGESEKEIATITHLDIVPIGNGWDNDPFVLTEREGYLLGRGVIDNKGPSIICLYLMKYFKEKGEKLPHTLKALFGTDEERGMSDIVHYLANNKAPDFAFSPDSSFPVCCGEKGIAGFDLIGELSSNSNIISINAGTAANLVPDRAEAVIKAEAEDLLDTEYVKVSKTTDGIKLMASGKGGHAAFPDNTVNAIAKLVAYLIDNKLIKKEDEAYFDLLGRMHSDTSGKLIGMDCVDEVFTPLSCVGCMIKTEGKKISQNVNIRFPAKVNGAWVGEKIEKAAAEVGAKSACIMMDEPFYLEPTLPEIAALTKAYTDITGKDGTPYTISGGTYARHFPKAVAFGPDVRDINHPDFVGTAHGANEGVRKDTLLNGLEIIITAVENLMKI